MKIIYLIPPSEGKNSSSVKLPVSRGTKEMLSFNFKKPIDIAIHATEKDLKCSGKRYEEGIELNTKLCSSSCSEERADLERMTAIERYSGVMYNAIAYNNMTEEGKRYFSKHFIMLSGMYGLLRPEDEIGNYKLPIESKGLYQFWGSKITETLNCLDIDYIVDLLPGTYKKMIQWDDIEAHIVQVDFLSRQNNELKKISHAVKKLKGEYIHRLCSTPLKKLEDLPGELEKISDNRYHIHLIYES